MHTAHYVYVCMYTVCMYVSLLELNSRKTKAPLDLILFGGGFCYPYVEKICRRKKVYYGRKGLENVK